MSISLISIVLLIADLHPLIKFGITFFYCFLIPASLIEDYLQTKFVGLQIRGKSIFLTPAFLPIWIIVSIPFWAYEREFTSPAFDWVAFILMIMILIGSLIALQSARLLNIKITSKHLMNSVLFAAGLIIGLILAQFFL